MVNFIKENKIITVLGILAVISFILERVGLINP